MTPISRRSFLGAAALAAGAAIWDVYTSPEGPKRFQYAAYDGSGNALRDCAYLFTRGGR
jgi:hypothetical protein